MEPWICPRCGTVWAGWVAKCKCKPQSVSSRSANTYDVECTCYKKSDDPDNTCPIHDAPFLPLYWVT